MEQTQALILYCNQVELNPVARFRVWFFRLICKGFFAKVPRKQWRKRRCPWKPLAHTAPLQRQVKGTWWTMKLCYFLVEFSQHGLARLYSWMPPDRSHSYRLHAFWVRLNSTKGDSCNPTKDKREVRERFATDFCLFAKNGCLMLFAYNGKFGLITPPWRSEVP